MAFAAPDPRWKGRSELVQVGWGGFAVEDGSLRTDCDEKGLGLLLYRKEKFCNCQIRVVYRSKDAKSNAGRSSGLRTASSRKSTRSTPRLAGSRTASSGKESRKTFREASEEERGPWHAVHHGYEIQICDDS